MLQVTSRRPQVLPMQASQERRKDGEEGDQSQKSDLQHLHQAHLQSQESKQSLQTSEDEEWQGDCLQGWVEEPMMEPTNLGA
uniref:Uncharacterized protein n=1 Tax=Arundo donax TaxID=35708 RepID=A0A0A9ESZ3_ARUDO